MGLVQQKVFFNVTLADNGGNKSTIRFTTNKTDLADLAADIAEFTGAGGLLADLQAVTRAVVVGYSAGVSFAEDTDLYAAANVQIEDLAEISALIAGEPDKWAVVRIPAPENGIFAGSEGELADTIDPADADLVAYLANFESGGIVQVSDGEYLADSATPANFKGKRIHRASRKG